MIPWHDRFETLLALNRVTWGALRFAWKQHALTEGQIERFANERYERSSEHSHKDEIALLACATMHPAESIEHALDLLATHERKGPDDAIDRWRLATLVALNAQSLSWDEVMLGIESIAAEFNYPEDMNSLSRYVTPDAPRGTDPVERLPAVIEALTQGLERT